MSHVTQILQAIEGGDAQAASALLPVVYEELRRLAAQRLAVEKPGQTLQATALVHEAYLKLVGENEARWNSRSHFFAAAAESMRRILIDGARRKRALRHGGDRKRIELGDVVALSEGESDELLALDEGLGKLGEEDPTKAELVKLRYFGGLSIEEAAADLGISRATAARYWEYARAFLRHQIRAADSQVDDRLAKKPDER
jgi:RNA polymerase sigma factor (TIGR02999 family)